MKKAFSLVLALIMVMSLATTAFASEATSPEPTYTLTINNTAHDALPHTYEAYQILDGTVGTSQSILSEPITWGSGIINAGAMLAEIKAATTVLGQDKDGKDYSLATLFATAEGPTSFTDCLADTITLSQSAVLNALADIITSKDADTGAYKYLDVSKAVASTNNGNGTYTVSGLQGGYYLVKDKDGTQDGEQNGIPTPGGYYTHYIMRLVGNVTVTPKGSPVTVEKNISDNLNGEWDSHEDFDFADFAYFKLDTTLPNNYTEYDVFEYTFHDTLSTGLTVRRIESVYIDHVSGNDSYLYSFTGVDPYGNTVNSDIDAIPEFETNVQGLDEYNTLDKPYFTFTNTKSANFPVLVSSDKLVVVYSAKINKLAIVGTSLSNFNEVYGEYTNDPNGDGKGRTDDDKTYAFTFDMNIKKVDADDTTKALAGAEFVVYYRVANGAGGYDYYYAKAITKTDFEAEKPIGSGKPTTDDIGKVYQWVKNDQSQGTTFVTDENGKFLVSGLDARTYFLKETKAPNDYNLIADPIRVDITATYNEDSNGELLSASVSYSVNSTSASSSSNEITITNTKGNALPSTGGVGTTLFYLIGGTLVAAALVMFITKKRLANAE